MLDPRAKALINRSWFNRLMRSALEALLRDGKLDLDGAAAIGEAHPQPQGGDMRAAAAVGDTLIALEIVEQENNPLALRLIDRAAAMRLLDRYPRLPSIVFASELLN